MLPMSSNTLHVHSCSELQDYLSQRLGAQPWCLTGRTIWQSNGMYGHDGPALLRSSNMVSIDPCMPAELCLRRLRSETCQRSAWDASDWHICCKAACGNAPEGAAMIKLKGCSWSAQTGSEATSQGKFEGHLAQLRRTHGPLACSFPSNDAALVTYSSCRCAAAAVHPMATPSLQTCLSTLCIR